LDGRIIDAEDRRTVKRNFIDEGEKSCLDILEVAVVIEVIRFDICKNGDGR
jgi:hypothetical protein